jgi:membrane protein DedA with SNARE-associated domain
VTLDGLGGPLVYLSILVAAAVEGEVAFVVAAAVVGQGHLNPFGVALAGAAGASLGDQFYFYLLRGRFRRWVDRHEWLARRGQILVHHVRRHEVPMVLMIRFAPGLRIALAAACAYAGVGRLRFSVLSIVASLAWAAGLLVLVAWVGPAYLPALGISGWWSALVPALLIVILFNVVGRLERRVFVDGQGSDEGLGVARDSGSGARDSS